MKNISMFRIYHWMIELLDLKNSELVVYAFIYSFTGDNKGIFRGNLSYISEKTGYSKNEVLRALKKLTTKGMLIKKEKKEKCFKRVEYKCSTKYLDSAKRKSTSEYDEKSYYTIWSWMTENFKLTGHYLTCYALLHSFSKTKIREFKGNSSYLAKRLNVSSRSMNRILKHLIDKSLILETQAYNPKTKVFAFRTVGCQEYEDNASISMAENEYAEEFIFDNEDLSCNTATPEMDEKTSSSGLCSQTNSGFSFDKYNLLSHFELNKLKRILCCNLKENEEMISTIIDTISEAIITKLSRTNSSLLNICDV